ncbi:hypothetical protein TESG_08171 [Trichophyton tonsurans CBS 112818]|uniref:Uncharacterized protein n=1 Tax=Trichophyton tonsurans (strain CBS 112818) TaxID=647933 RepID=F2SBC0_TRIT1|nr:hypothetical protein TESG_08171 [Trichophyton tonsurans CBS 112818]
MGGTTPPPAHSATKNKRRDERPEGEEWIYLNWGIFLWWTENRYLLVKLNAGGSSLESLDIAGKRRLNGTSDPKKDKEEIKRHLAEVEDLIQEGEGKEEGDEERIKGSGGENQGEENGVEEAVEDAEGGGKGVEDGVEDGVQGREKETEGEKEGVEERLEDGEEEGEDNEGVEAGATQGEQEDGGGQRERGQHHLGLHLR